MLILPIKTKGPVIFLTKIKIQFLFPVNQQSIILLIVIYLTKQVNPRLLIILQSTISSQTIPLIKQTPLPILSIHLILLTLESTNQHPSTISNHLLTCSLHLIMYRPLTIPTIVSFNKHNNNNKFLDKIKILNPFNFQILPISTFSISKIILDHKHHFNLNYKILYQINKYSILIL